jgi:hypothetical protein
MFHRSSAQSAAQHPSSQIRPGGNFGFHGEVVSGIPSADSIVVSVAVS